MVTINELKAELRVKREGVKLYTRPLHVIYYFVMVILESIQSLLEYCYNSQLVSSAIGVVVVTILLIWFLPGSYFGQYVNDRNVFREESEFVVMWIFLGILSSVGLGSGLHTFLLFLGPYIIRIAVTASMCRTTDFNTSILWFQSGNFFNLVSHPKEAFQCVLDSTLDHISFWAILMKIQYPSLLWGFGTAIGELPPYFIARAARLKGEKLQELDEALDAQGHGFMHRVKEKVYEYIQSKGFIFIMLFASIPNPLFDLAGLTCGHFLVPFWTFFGATAIGKAIIKTHIQSIAYVILFNKSTFERLDKIIRNNIPFLTKAVDLMDSAISNIAFKTCGNKDKYKTTDDCKTCCGQMLERETMRRGCNENCSITAGDESASLFKQLWELFIISMISYFIYTLIDSSVQAHLGAIDEAVIAKFEKDEESKKPRKDKTKAEVKGRNVQYKATYTPKWTEVDGKKEIKKVTKKAEKKEEVEEPVKAEKQTRGRSATRKVKPSPAKAIPKVRSKSAPKRSKSAPVKKKKSLK